MVGKGSGGMQGLGQGSIVPPKFPAGGSLIWQGGAWRGTKWQGGLQLEESVVCFHCKLFIFVADLCGTTI